jgi:hypothetical protein
MSDCVSDAIFSKTISKQLEWLITYMYYQNAAKEDLSRTSRGSQSWKYSNNWCEINPGNVKPWLSILSGVIDFQTIYQHVSIDLWVKFDLIQFLITIIKRKFKQWWSPFPSILDFGLHTKNLKKILVILYWNNDLQIIIKKKKDCKYFSNKILENYLFRLFVEIFVCLFFKFHISNS